MTSLEPKSLAAHVIVALASSQRLGRAARTDEIADEIGVRKTDVREIVTQLHAEGHVDGLRLRLTMSGLALAAALDGKKLKDLRRIDHAALTVKRVA